MFSVQQKRDISDAVQQVLRSTNHPELPETGEISFMLHVDGAKEWSWADIQNNGAVGDPGVNPHNETMASMPEEEGRALIDKAQQIADHPDPRVHPDELMTEMLKQQIGTLSRRVFKAEAIVVDYNQRLNNLESALSRDSGTADSDVNPLVSPMEQLRRVVEHVHALEDRDKIKNKLYSEVNSRLERVEEFCTPLMEDNSIADLSNKMITLREDNKSLHTRLDRLETAIRQLGSPLVDGDG